jgi:hypothetical protein
MAVTPTPPNEEAQLPTKIKVEGVEYDIPDRDDWTLDDAQLLEKFAYPNGNERPSMFGQLIGLIIIAKLHAGETVNYQAIGELKLGDIEPVMADPPTNRAARRAAAKRGASVTTLASSGTRTSTASLASDPGKPAS